MQTTADHEPGTYLLTKSACGLPLLHNVDDDMLQLAENLCKYCTHEMKMKQWTFHVGLIILVLVTVP